jgi:hypothetical protein
MQYDVAPHEGAQSCVVVCCGCVASVATSVVASVPPSPLLVDVPHARKTTASVVTNAFMLQG